MDQDKLLALFHATLQPDQDDRKRAEQTLNQMKKIAGFPACLLELIKNKDLPNNIKQSISIYLKNIVDKCYAINPDEPTKFIIHENDKINLRQNILECIVTTPETIRNQLIVITKNIIKSDYATGKWTMELNEEILKYLSVEDSENKQHMWLAGLLTLLQLTKTFEYSKDEEREIFIQAMSKFLPFLKKRVDELILENSPTSMLLTKIILKIFFALTQYNMPISIFNFQSICNWMTVFTNVLKSQVPPADDLDEEDRAEMPHWKSKKWSLHIINKMFEKYGKPGAVEDRYEEFAKYFMSQAAVQLLNIQLEVLDQKAKGAWVSARVLQLILTYMEQCISHTTTWAVLKGDTFSKLLSEIIYPQMCFTESDQELWDDDPEEYIRQKFDIFEELVSVKSAAETFVMTACNKRKQILGATMTFTQNLLSKMPNLPPEQIDGIFNLICAVHEQLLKKKPYKQQLDTVTKDFFIPLCKEQQGYLRARGLFCIKTFSNAKFKSSTITETLEVTLDLLSKQEELPVKVEAAMAIAKIATSQVERNTTIEFMKINIGNTLTHILDLINKTANDDLLDVVKQFIQDYSTEIEPFAVQLAEGISKSFISMADKAEEEEDNYDDKCLAAVGMLTTLETLLDILENNETLVTAVEEIIVKVIAWIFEHSKIDYYEEALSLLSSITTHHISENVWPALDLLRQILEGGDNGGVEYFVDMMPALHNYITVDSIKFFSDQNNLQIIFGMLKFVLDSQDSGEEAETHALKMLEVLIFQAGNNVPGVIENAIQLAYTRGFDAGQREVKTMEMKIMIQQVLLSALYYDKNNSCSNYLSGKGWFNDGIEQWLSDFDNIMGIHDRRVSLLLISKLLSMENRPEVITNNITNVLSKCIAMFKKLEVAYSVQADILDSDDEGDSDEEENEMDHGDNEDPNRGNIQQLDDNESDEEDKNYMDMLKNFTLDDDPDNGETMYEDYTTVIDEDGIPYTGLEKDSDGATIQHEIPDEYIIFTATLENIEQTNPDNFKSLISSLSEDDQKALEHVGNLAKKRYESQLSKKLEKQGGYKFDPNLAANIEFSSASNM